MMVTIMKKYIILTLLVLVAITGCQQNPIGGDRDQNGCLTGAGYSFDKEVGACTRNWELNEHEKEVARNVLLVQSYSSFTVVSIEKIDSCEDCYDVTLQRNPIDEYTQEEDFQLPYTIPYREGRIDFSYDNPIIQNFEECIAAGYPAMESYPRQCRDPNTDTTFNEVIGEPIKPIYHECTQEEKENNICTKEYNPVCALEDNGVRCITAPCASTDAVTSSTGCTACSQGALGYYKGACEDNYFAICKGIKNGLDIDRIASDAGWICVDICPGNYDVYTTQIGVQMCIEHYGKNEISNWETCERSSENCQCVKAYETTDGEEILDAEYRCVPDMYSESMLFRGGRDFLDENGKQAVMIA